MTDDHDKHLSQEDLNLWQRVAATVKRSLPMPPGDPAHEKTKIKPDDIIRSDTDIPNKKTPIKRPAPPQKKGTSLDRRTEQRLKQGKITIDETIDMHGMTQDQAHGLLVQRLTAAHKNGRRLVLVITGKGLRSKEQGGVLRNALPVWCGMPPLSDIILKRTTARPQHGGSGAFYIYLRRKR